MIYTLASAAPLEVSGSYNIQAVVSEPKGWKRTIPLQPETPFSGGVFGAQAKLDVCEVNKLIDAMVELTGLPRSSYDVTITTQITQQGTLGGQPYIETIQSPLLFGLDLFQFYLVTDPANPTDPLHWKQESGISLPIQETVTLSFFGLKLAVSLVRVLGLVFGLLGLAGLGLLNLAPGLLPAPGDRLAGLRARYGHLLVKAQALPAAKGGEKIVDVQSMEDLARLAQQAGTLILELAQGEETHFIVLTAPVAYRFILR
jgi:hypothetical protein